MTPAKKRQLAKTLKSFSDDNEMTGKGPLSVALILTRRASSMGVPLDPKNFLTPKGGQVAGLSGGTVQSILADHGITRVLSEEGGRTSRGSISRMRGYVDLLNCLHAKRPTSIDEMIAAYNAIIDECETDPSLKIALG